MFSEIVAGDYFSICKFICLSSIHQLCMEILKAERTNKQTFLLGPESSHFWTCFCFHICNFPVHFQSERCNSPRSPPQELCYQHNHGWVTDRQLDKEVINISVGFLLRENDNELFPESEFRECSANPGQTSRVCYSCGEFDRRGKIRAPQVLSGVNEVTAVGDSLLLNVSILEFLLAF